jgi:hypothetical protein
VCSEGVIALPFGRSEVALGSDCRQAEYSSCVVRTSYWRTTRDEL